MLWYVSPHYTTLTHVFDSSLQPLAMRLVAESVDGLDGRVRRACRDLFFGEKLAERLVSIVDEVFDAADRA